MDRFANAVAIVTGGASGIGAALCRELATRQAIVIVADRDEAGARAIADTLMAAGGRAWAYPVDVSRADAMANLIDETVARHGRLDLIINNAGVALMGEVRDMTLDDWRPLVDVNLWGVIHGTTLAYTQMLRQGSGHIVNVASAAGLFPSPLAAAYATTKHAVVGLSISLRAEAAALGIRVSVVCPGHIRTSIFQTMPNVTPLKDEAAMRGGSMGMMEPAACARLILRGVSRNQAIIPITTFTHLVWRIYRYVPVLLTPLLQRIIADFRARRVDAAPVVRPAP